MRIKSYKELIVWQKSMDIAVDVYRITKTFPKSELYGLISQIRRSAFAIPANIAEGSARGHLAEYIQFLRIAFSSGAELETHLLVAKRVGMLNARSFNKINKQLEEIMKMLNVLISKLAKPKAL